jgi:hypothetical protein
MAVSAFLAALWCFCLAAAPALGSQYEWVVARVTDPSGVTNYGGQNFQNLDIKTADNKDIIKSWVRPFSGDTSLYTEAQQNTLGEVENQVVTYFQDTFTFYPRDSVNNPNYFTPVSVLITVGMSGVFLAPAEPFHSPYAAAWYYVYPDYENNPNKKYGGILDTQGGGWGAPGWGQGLYGTNLAYMYPNPPLRQFYWGDQVTLRIEFGALAKNGAIVDCSHSGTISFAQPEGTGPLSVASLGGYRQGNPPSVPIPSILLLLSRAFGGGHFNLLGG